jgi:hypothetical protein
MKLVLRHEKEYDNLRFINSSTYIQPHEATDDKFYGLVEFDKVHKAYVLLSAGKFNLYKNGWQYGYGREEWSFKTSEDLINQVFDVAPSTGIWQFNTIQDLMNWADTDM